MSKAVTNAIHAPRKFLVAWCLAYVSMVARRRGRVITVRVTGLGWGCDQVCVCVCVCVQEGGGSQLSARGECCLYGKLFAIYVAGPASFLFRGMGTYYSSSLWV